MNKSALALALISFTASTMAVSGTITFTGETLDHTCEASVDAGGALGNTIKLSPMPVNQLKTAGQRIASAWFTIRVNGPTCVFKNVAIFFEDSDKVSAGYRLKNMAEEDGDRPKATNIELEIFNESSYDMVEIGQQSQLDDHFWKLTYGDDIIYYRADYVATDAATAGHFASEVTYTIKYQ